GHAEPNAEVFKGFRTVIADGGNTLYRKSSPEPAAWEPLPALDLPLPHAPAVPPKRALSRKHPREAAAAAHSKPADAPALARVRALADRGQWDEAASACRQLMETDGLNPALHFTLGLVLEHAGGEPAPSLERAIYLDRGFVLAHYHLGVVMQSARKFTRARRSFENVRHLLADRPSGEVLEHGDGITAAELRELARLHLELLNKMDGGSQ
ncbi:MAG: hypothetical protein M1541_10490, partial [Acidobacteria bacterium]|nr:hypothetical protein [Acidobacteriota bacterium]